MNIPPIRIEFSKADRDEVHRRIDRALAEGQVAEGANVKEFEEEFARYQRVPYAVAANSGGGAIEMAMRLFDVKDQEVLVPTNTFLATASGVLVGGGRVKLVDADASTFSVSLATLESAVGPDTAGVCVVHIGGLVTPEMPAIRQWCDEKGLWLFEDAAHAHGSDVGGISAGNFGHMAEFSFFATKVITSGEGGMLVVHDADLDTRARGLRNYGKPDPWVTFHTQIGSNWRMSEFCAAVGIVHLRRCDEFIEGRKRVADFYTRELNALPDIEIVLPEGRSSWYKFIVLLPTGMDKGRVVARMKEKGVSLAGSVYDVPLHRQPVFEGMHDGHFPVADDICGRHICLPIYHSLTEEECRYVVDAFKDTVAEA